MAPFPRILKITALIGIVILLAGVGGIVFFTLNEGQPSPSVAAGSVQSLLSTLKRQRGLVFENPGNQRLLDQYRESAEKAADAYPGDENLAAIAAEAFILSNEDASPYASRISKTELLPLALSALVLSGSFESPASAETALGSSTLASLTTNSSLTIDLALLHLLRGEISEAAAMIHTLLDTNPNLVLKLAAEFYYDFGDPLEAAELFSRLSSVPGLESPDMQTYVLERQADSLALAGKLESARTFWRLLSVPDATGSYTQNTDALARSLYNLALSESDESKAAAYLEQLLTLNSSYTVSAAIRYTRLQNRSRALAILQEEGVTEPLLDLEQLRYQLETLRAEDAAPQVWLLLNRHPGESELYHWAAWYFTFERLYNEAVLLINQARALGMDESNDAWVSLYDALLRMRRADFNGAETLLKGIIESNESSSDWEAYADLGLAMESGLSTAEALNYYIQARTAFENTQEADNSGLVRLYIAIARCQRTLGRSNESRQTLQEALNLDPENTELMSQIRLELNRDDF
jgi:tetratricopeptide (TPR) repeat protein